MEAANDGELVRQHHDETSIRIPCVEGSKFRIQRGTQRGDGIPILCPSEFVSKFHCEILRRDRAYWIKDLKSTNGTFLNGNKLTPNIERELRFSDVIGIGVSHQEPDSGIDLNDTKYYVYLFRKLDVHLEVINVDEQNELRLTSKNNNDNFFKRPLPKDDDDIQFVGEFQSSSASSNSPSPKKRPPAPPPPKLSQIAVALTSASNISKETEALAAIPKSKSPSLLDNSPGFAGSTIRTTASVKVSNTKESLVSAADNREKNYNSSNVRRRHPTSSSDDSSDGLGESESNIIKPVKVNLKSGQKSDVNGSATETDQKVNNKADFYSKPQVTFGEKNVVGVEQNGRINRLKTSVDTNVLSKDAADTCQNFDVIEQKQRLLNRNDELKEKAKNSNPIVRLHCPIVFLNGNFSLSRKIYNTTTPASRTRLKEQFETSLKEHMPHLFDCQQEVQKENRQQTGERDHRKRPVTPSDSESENDTATLGSRNKHKRVCQDAPIDSEKKQLNADRRADSTVVTHNVSEDDGRLQEKHARLSSPLIIPTTSKPKTIKLIEDAPLPRFAARAQHKAASSKHPSPRLASESKGRKSFTTTSIDVSDQKSPSSLGQARRDLPKDEKKRIRNLLLKQVELKKQSGMEKVDVSVSPKKCPARIKVTARNRNEGLMESIISSNKDESPLSKGPDGDVYRGHAEESSAPAIKTTVTSSDLKANSDKHGIINGERKINAPSVSVVTGIKSSSTVITSKLLKVGAEIIKSPPAKVANIIYKETVCSKRKLPTPSSLEYTTLISEEDIFKRILSWRVAWLQEQKSHKMARAPPVAENLDVTSTLVDYQSYRDYLHIYYPLLLFEIWAVISNDAVGKSKISGNSARSRTTEYKIAIDKADRRNMCAFARSKGPGQQNLKSSKDDPWCEITYHTWLKTPDEIESKKDFVILRMSVRENGTDKVVQKEYFGMAIFSTVRQEHVSGVVKCDPRLHLQKGHHGFRFSETIVCRSNSNFIVDKKSLGYVRRICPIMPKIREFRALNTLQSSKLFHRIISPPEVKNTWENNIATLKPHEMVSITRQLNSEQQSMISYIVDRVFSNEPELMLMHGPPGTGKTKTIVCLVLQLILAKQQKRIGSRILICTPSNAAIDEIMRRLVLAIGQLPVTDNKIEIVRVGEGYSQEFEMYAVNNLARKKEEETSTLKSLKAEMTALETEIQEKQQKIQERKNESNLCPITMQAELSELLELETRKKSLSEDLHSSSKKKMMESGDKSPRGQVLKGAQIICSTLSASSNSQMKNIFGRFITNDEKPFLCCIVDEASQTTEPETLLPLVLEVDKLLLVGDHRQLGATVLSNDAEKKQFGQSLFTRLHKHYNRPAYRDSNPIMMLKRQYRMHPDIMQWPNVYFYGGELVTLYNPPKKYHLRPYCLFNLSSGREHSEKDGQIQNLDEVVMVQTLLETIEDLLSKLAMKWTVGVITPYSAQKHGIRKALENKHSNVFQSIEVDTVDGFQGQEKDIIVLSCVRTDSTGFLKSPNRLNVALTRAKHSLYIIGDLRCLSQDDMWKCLIQNAAERKCKEEIKPDFRCDLKLLKSLLSATLTTASPKSGS